MRRELTITSDPIDEVSQVKSREATTTNGAVIHFLGVVRDVESGQPITAIDYEVFTAMARRQFDLIFDQVEKRWPVASVRLIHRVGKVPAGEVSLWVEVIAPHRAEAFSACQFLIDEMKRVVPIWKHACE